jgi:hypothetical protein
MAFFRNLFVNLQDCIVRRTHVRLRSILDLTKKFSFTIRKLRI